jgi:hypothetical protein
MLVRTHDRRIGLGVAVDVLLGLSQRDHRRL